MELTTWQKSVVAIDAIGPILFTGLFGIMRYRNKISRSLWLTYLYGIVLTSIWEVSFGLAGDSFLIFKFNNPLGFSVHILHAFWDSIILLFGMYFIHIRNDNEYSGLKQLLILTIYGLIQEFIVEVMFNDTYWYYKTDNKNYTKIIDQLERADAHPYGARPFKRENYIKKFKILTDKFLSKKESKRFLKNVQNLRKLKNGQLGKLNIEVGIKQIKKNNKKSIF